jgi:putative transposase
MRVRGLAARRRRRFRVTTQSRHPFPVAPNALARQFERTGPDQAWVTDITYIPTGEGWLYLAVILDLCSRLAVGWAMNERLNEAERSCGLRSRDESHHCRRRERIRATVQITVGPYGDPVGLREVERAGRLLARDDVMPEHT